MGSTAERRRSSRLMTIENAALARSRALGVPSTHLWNSDGRVRAPPHQLSAMPAQHLCVTRSTILGFDDVSIPIWSQSVSNWYWYLSREFS